MKYSQGYSAKKRKMGTGFYMVIACCLLIIGASSWFALSNYAKEETTPELQNSSEYKDKISSYTESKPQENVSSVPSTPTEDVAENVSSEPYSSEQSIVAEESKTKVFTMPVEGEIIKDFSDTQLQYSSTYSDMRLHLGIDIACENGTAVSACSDGKVLSVENTSYLGNTVLIDHNNGIVIKYASLENVKLKSGDKVSVGDIIGNIGTVPSECSDKSHLHIEVIKNEKNVPPLDVIKVD